jgi:hypothetical protein
VSTDRVHLPGTDPVTRAINQLSHSSALVTASIEARLTALENAHVDPFSMAMFDETTLSTTSTAWQLIASGDYTDFDIPKEKLLLVFGYDGYTSNVASTGHIRVAEDDIEIYDDDITRTGAGVIHTHPIVYTPTKAAFTMKMEYRNGTPPHTTTINSWFAFSVRVRQEGT